MHTIRVYAIQHDLKPSYTFYKQWGQKGKKIKLRLSKSGDLDIEKHYSTHYVVKLEKIE